MYLYYTACYFFNLHNPDRPRFSTNLHYSLPSSFFRLSRIVLDLNEDTSSEDSSESEDEHAVEKESEGPSLDPASAEMSYNNEYVLFV